MVGGLELFVVLGLGFAVQCYMGILKYIPRSFWILPPTQQQLKHIYDIDKA